MCMQEAPFWLWVTAQTPPTSAAAAVMPAATPGQLLVQRLALLLTVPAGCEQRRGVSAQLLHLFFKLPLPLHLLLCCLSPAGLAGQLLGQLLRPVALLLQQLGGLSHSFWVCVCKRQGCVE